MSEALKAIALAEEYQRRLFLAKDIIAARMEVKGEIGRDELRTLLSLLFAIAGLKEADSGVKA